MRVPIQIAQPPGLLEIKKTPTTKPILSFDLTLMSTLTWDNRERARDRDKKQGT